MALSCYETVIQFDAVDINTHEVLHTGELTYPKIQPPAFAHDDPGALEIHIESLARLSVLYHLRSAMHQDEEIGVKLKGKSFTVECTKLSYKPC